MKNNKIKLLSLLLSGIMASSFAQTYVIDKDASEIKILVYKNGILSGLAHNHVIVIKEFNSSISWNDEDFTKSTLQFEIPINEFIVDDPVYRSEEGVDFEKEVSDEDRKEIFNTMLDEDHLYAEKFPKIYVRIVGFSGTVQTPVAKLEINLHGVAKKYELPIELYIDNAKIQAKGQLKILQTDFKIKPHSAALGMIGVNDELTIKFNITAGSK